MASEIVKQLQSLELSKYPVDEVRRLIGQFGKFGTMTLVLHSGKEIIRGRVNCNDEKFTSRSSLSYKPAKFNTTFQRASTPAQTMFYGGILPEKINPGELESSRIVAAMEGSNMLRDVKSEGEQIITFGKWVVTKDIPLIAICNSENLAGIHSFSKELFDNFHKQIESLDPELREKSKIVTAFLADEFSKPVPHDAPDYHYMLSAIFTEMAVNKGVGGIFYPSVRTEALGFNVAIAPQSVDSSLRLVAAGECTLYKKGKHTIGDNETVCIIEDDTKTFEFKPVAPQDHMGRENVLAKFKE